MNQGASQRTRSYTNLMGVGEVRGTIRFTTRNDGVYMFIALKGRENHVQNGQGLRGLMGYFGKTLTHRLT